MEKIIVPWAIRWPPGQGLGKFRIHVMREEITGMAGMHDEIGPR